MLDVGLLLDDADADTMPLHPVPGFDKPDDSLLGVVISHPHQDHYGLAHRLPEETMCLIGKAVRGRNIGMMDGQLSCRLDAQSARVDSI